CSRQRNYHWYFDVW
nr:immunoglobulin heavy chain junction region [Mus musculus]MBK4197296.1 immunoglobulin heavy chain junction region [Mus musculus]